MEKASSKKKKDKVMKSFGDGKSKGHQAEQPPLWRDILALLGKIAALGILFVLLFTVLFGLLRNQDAGMYPGVKDGDLVVFYRLDKKYHAQDLLILDYQGQRQVRRVVAVAGDTVDITEEGLLVNGSPQQEKAIYESTKRYDSGLELPLTLKEGEVFVLGDAREHATDSRIYGVVDTKKTLGKVMMIIRRREF